MKLQENTARWRRTKRGVVTNIYGHMKNRNTVSITLSEFHEFADCQKFDRLFSEWEDSRYHKQFKPSIDRINKKHGYSIGNMQWLTWAENRYKQTMERRCRKGAVIKMMGSSCVEYYKSQREAVMKTGLSQSGISMCLTGQRQTCGGYGWKYEKDIYSNPELTK